MGSFSLWHWLVVLAIIAMIFGTAKLRNIGSDLGAAVKNFKNGVKEEGNPPALPSTEATQAPKSVHSN